MNRVYMGLSYGTDIQFQSVVMSLVLIFMFKLCSCSLNTGYFHTGDPSCSSPYLPNSSSRPALLISVALPTDEAALLIVSPAMPNDTLFVKITMSATISSPIGFGSLQLVKNDIIYYLKQSIMFHLKINTKMQSNFDTLSLIAEMFQTFEWKTAELSTVNQMYCMNFKIKAYIW